MPLHSLPRFLLHKNRTPAVLKPTAYAKSLLSHPNYYQTLVFNVTPNASQDTSAELLVELAITHHQHGRFAQAYETFFKAATRYRTLNQPDLAAQTFRRLLRLETSNLTLQFSLVENFLELGLNQEAFQAFYLCADHDDTPQALEHFFKLAKALSRLNPNDKTLQTKVFDVMLRETQLHLSNKHFDKAKTNIERGLHYFPKSVRFHELMLELTRENETLDTQLPWLLKLAKLTQNNPQTAIQYLNRALTITTNHDEVFNTAKSIGLVLPHPEPNDAYEIEEIIEEEIEESLRTTVASVFNETTVQATSAPSKEREILDLENPTTLRKRLALRLNLNSKDSNEPHQHQQNTHHILMLHHLLRTVENCQTATTITIFSSQSDSGPHAELIACNNRLATKITLNGETLTTTDEKHPNTDEQYTNTASALLKIGQAFDKIPFEITQSPASLKISHHNTLSPVQLLMAITRLYTKTSQPDEATEFFQTTRTFSEQGWLFMSPQTEIDLPLPLQCKTDSNVDIETTVLIGRVLNNYAKFIQNSGVSQHPNRPTLAHLIVVDTTYACLSTPEHIAVVNVAHNQLGQTLRAGQQSFDTP